MTAVGWLLCPRRLHATRRSYFFEGHPLAAASGRVRGWFWRLGVPTHATPGPPRASARLPNACVVILVGLVDRRRGGLAGRIRRVAYLTRHLPGAGSVGGLRPGWRHPAHPNGGGEKAVCALGRILRNRRVVQIFPVKNAPKCARCAYLGGFAQAFSVQRA